jgi:hypothetical protein
VKDYAAKAKEFYSAMIDAKAIGEHYRAGYYHSQYVMYKNKAEQAGQPDINCTDIEQT